MYVRKTMTHEQKVDLILDRISVAKPYSKIAVFKDKEGIVSKFAQTVEIQRWIKDGLYSYIGSFDNSDSFDPVSVKQLLMNHAPIES